jgi:hypothetical protein
VLSNSRDDFLPVFHHREFLGIMPCHRRFRHRAPAIAEEGKELNRLNLVAAEMRAAEMPLAFPGWVDHSWTVIVKQP